jgi:tetratricopeptide (TPR) repeat protein
MIDAAAIIHGSGDFLKKLEPEMTESEQSVYDKVAPILSRRPEFALKLLKSMAGTTPDGASKPTPAFEFMLGNAFYSVNDFPEAEKKYRSAVDRNPAFVKAWKNLGVLYYVQDRYAEAAPCFSRGVALGDRDPTTFGLFGTSLEKTGNTVSAESAYMQALSADPANLNWTEGLLRLYLADKQEGKAETLVQTLLKAHPRETKYGLTYLTLLLNSHRKLEAIALLQRMSETGLAREEDEALLADLYAAQGMTAEALATLERLAVSQPELAGQKRLRFARSLIAARNWSVASTVLETLSHAPQSSPRRIAYLEARVELELARKNWIEAKSEIQMLLKEAPQSGSAWMQLGRVHLAETEEAEAVAAFEHAREIPESAYRASLELANIACKNRRYAQCLGHLDHALGIQRSPAVQNFRNQIRNLVASETHPPP